MSEDRACAKQNGRQTIGRFTASLHVGQFVDSELSVKV
jgi:hypothetical protein